MLLYGLSLLTVGWLAQAGATPATPSPLAVSFTSSHHLLSDESESYRRGGQRFDGPDWTEARAHPITHTGGRLLEASVVLGARGLAATDVRVVGKVYGMRIHGVELVGAAHATGGTITAQVKSAVPLPAGIFKDQLTIDWWVDLGRGPVGIGSTGPHVVYVTLGTPVSARDPNEDIVHRYPASLPPGVTVKRMEAAMKLVGRALAETSTDTHALVGKLMDVFPGFLLAQGSHYINDTGGAWLLADVLAQSGECQAIVRLVKAVLDMVGASGRLELVKLYADPDNPTVPIELPWGTDQVPPPAKRMKLVASGEERRGWGVALLAEKPAFPDEDEAKPEYGTCWKVGPVAAATDRPRFLTERPNNFQAALKVSADGATAYYGGGVGGYAFAAKEALFASAFWGMVWTMLAPLPVQAREAWDEKTVAAMRRMGVAPTRQPSKPGSSRPRADGFRLMEIIHIYDDEDHCR
jgi:hypothetical protein